MDPLRRLRLGLGALGPVILGGSAGYMVLGFGALDALSQAVTPVSTVGFREVERPTGTGKVFTIVLILVGVGTAFYTFSVSIEVFIEGQIRELLGRRRMERTISSLSGHVVICGWGRVGRALAQYVTGS